MKIRKIVIGSILLSGISFISGARWMHKLHEEAIGESFGSIPKERTA